MWRSNLSFASLVCLVGLGVARQRDTFTEELLFEPLPNDRVYAFFQFTTLRPEDSSFHHTHLFPRSLGEIISRYKIEELHLSLTEGLWRHVDWGYPVVDAPPGAELYAWFSETSDDVDGQWKKLTETLSGLFCASLNFIDSSNTFSPELSFRPTGVRRNFGANSSFVRYATLPREIVCTENLTPWKKLLPCDSKRGLATLLNSGKLHNTNYHSLGVHFRTICTDDACTKKSYELKQTMSLVYDSEIVGTRDWSILKLFGQGVIGPCPLASRSLIYVDITSNDTVPFILTPDYDYANVSIRSGIRTELAVYDLNKRSNSAFNIAAIHRSSNKITLYIPPPVHVNRFIAGYGQERSSIVTYVYNNHWQSLDILFLENIPWFLPVYLHTLVIESNDKSIVPKSKKYIPGKGKMRPYYLELALRLPPKSVTKISIEFDYVFLKWQEYPPDANHGFYVGSAIVTALLPIPKNFTSSISYFGLLESSFAYSKPGYIVQLHTETMIITLPTPDFSMPYNVICLACTVVALAFGPLHNITTKSLHLSLEYEEKSKSILQKLKSIFRKNNSTTNNKETDLQSTQDGDENNT